MESLNDREAPTIRSLLLSAEVFVKAYSYFDDSFAPAEHSKRYFADSAAG